MTNTEAGPARPGHFEKAYEGRAPWDIEGPQPAIRSAFEEGVIKGRVLDVGCGTGENALFLAEEGLEVTGVDLVPRAIEQARAKASERGLSVAFRVANVLEDRTDDDAFDTVIDSGVFHVFDDADRARYVAALDRLVARGGRYVTVVFSDQEPTDWGGPRRVSRAELEDAFSGWAAIDVEPARFLVLLDGVTGHAWRAVVTKHS